MKKNILLILLITTCSKCFAIGVPPWGGPGNSNFSQARVLNESDSDLSESSEESLEEEVSKTNTDELLKGIEILDDCIICYDELETKSTPCCRKQICGICWHKCLQDKPRCPHCRQNPWNIYEEELRQKKEEIRQEREELEHEYQLELETNKELKRMLEKRKQMKEELNQHAEETQASALEPAQKKEKKNR